jgi:hypothetical protein
MIRRFFWFFLLGAGMGMYTALPAETVSPAPKVTSTLCGQELQARDVLVLDLRRLGRDPEQAEAFVLEQAGEYRLTKPLIQEFRMPFRPSGNPEGVTRGARKLGLKKGCDLVLLLDSGPYLGRQRSWKARIKDHGYALVSVGQRVADSP